jgi:hypothetical protein
MGKTGRVNASELLTTLRYAKPGVVEAAPRSRGGPLRGGQRQPDCLRRLCGHRTPGV